MKNVWILLYLLPSFAANAQSITTERGDYIVTNNNDTVVVSIVHPSTEGMTYMDSVGIQHKLITITDRHSVEFSPRDLKAFHYRNSDYESIWCNENATLVSRQFCRRIVSGEIAIFRCQAIEKDTSGKNGLVSILYFKKDNDYKVASLLHLQQLLGPLKFRSCDSLKTIHTSEWDPTAFIAIVRQYNQYQQPKTSH